PVYVYFAQVQLPAPPSVANMDSETFWDGIGQEQERLAAKDWSADPRSVWPSVTLDLHRTWVDGCDPTAYRVLTRSGVGFSRAGAIWWTDCPHCGLAVPKLHGQVG